MGFTVQQPWTAWHSPSLDAPNKSVRAGYVTEYYTGNASNPRFTFLTVAGSGACGTLLSSRCIIVQTEDLDSHGVVAVAVGHMVPTNKPPQALSMIKTFLANKRFKSDDALDCVISHVATAVGQYW